MHTSWLIEALRLSRHSRHSGTRALKRQLGTLALKELGDLDTWGTRALDGPLGTKGTWALGHLRHLGTQGIWEIETLGDFKSNWALGHTRQLGSWAVGHLKRIWVLRHLGTQGTRGILFSGLVFDLLFGNQLLTAWKQRFRTGKFQLFATTS